MKKLLFLLISGSLLWAQNPSTSKTLLFSNINATVGAGPLTNYTTFGNSVFTGNESFRQFPMPYACIATKLFVTTGGVQSSTGSLVVTIRNNATSTPVTITVAANGAAGNYADLSHTVSFAAGDLMSIQFVNNATVASAAVVGVSLACL